MIFPGYRLSGRRTSQNCCKLPIRNISRGLPAPALLTPRAPSMSATPHPPSLAENPPLRVFGARPFHTDGDLLALAFAADGGLWSVEEPGVLRRWDVDARRQTALHALDEVATLWAFSRSARLAAA